MMVSKENAANTVTYETLASGGFLRIEESSAESLEAAPANAITAITAADKAALSISIPVWIQPRIRQQQQLKAKTL